MSRHDSRQIEDVKVMLRKGANGNSISTIEKTSTSGLVDTYTVTLTDGSQTTFTVTNGSSIYSIAKTSTSGLTDTYTVTLTNGETTTFQVTNARSITSIEKTSTSGLVDTYTITYNDETTDTFTVTNGKDVDVVDNLNSSDASKALSANQGRLLGTNLATIESTNTASQPYAVGDFLVFESKLHKVTQAIAQGGTLTVGTNIAPDTVGNELSAINTHLSSTLSKTKLAEVNVGSTDTWRTVLNALATQLDTNTITDYKMLVMVTPIHRWNGQYVRTTDSVAFNFVSLAGGGVQINVCSLLFSGNSLYRRQEGSSAITDKSTDTTGEQGTWTIWGFK